MIIQSSKSFLLRRFTLPSSVASSLRQRSPQSVARAFLSSSSSRQQDLRQQLDDNDAPTLGDFVKDASISPFEQESFYAGIRKPVNEARTIPPEAYRSPEFFKVEQDRVFRDSWTVVGYVDDLRKPGDVVSANAAGGTSIILTRAKDGVLRGFYNVCRHRGARLVQHDDACPHGNKKSRTSVISCPYHRWGYALDGRLLATPMWKGDGVTQAEALDCDQDEVSGEAPSKALQEAFSTDQVKNFHKSDYGLLPVRVETWGPYVYANLSGDAPPLSEYFGDMLTDIEDIPLDRLVTVRSSSVEVKANWKILAENYQEYYHLPSVHPELMEVMAVEDHSRAQGTGMYIGYVVHPLKNAGTPVDLGRLPNMPGLTEQNQSAAWFHHHFPNAFYFLLPHSFYSIVVEPTAHNTTIEHVRLLVDPEALNVPDADKVIEEMWEYYQKVNGEDLDICTEVQRGVSVEAYQGGRMTFQFEEPLNRFHHMIANYMTGSKEIPTGDSRPYEFQKEAARDVE